MPADPDPELDVPHTGVLVVDGVLGGLDGLERRPVEEQVPVFEQLHEGLRAALDDDAGDDPGGPGDLAGA